MVSGGGVAVAETALPEGAKPGQCFAKVLIPATYQTAPAPVVVKPETVQIKETAAEYKDVKKRVLVAEESFELVVIPAKFQVKKIKILVEPEKKIKKVAEAVYETVTEKFLVSPARIEWKKGHGPFTKIDDATGEIMCRVEVPAEYSSVEKTVLKSPAKVTEETVPAKYEIRERRVMVEPPRTERKVVPAKYETITVKELISPARYEEVKVPAETKMVDKRQLVAAERVQWREILCETNTTPEVVRDIQERLLNAGYGLGGSEATGNFGPATKAAILKFQKDNGLPTGGLTISTLRKLGIRS